MNDSEDEIVGRYAGQQEPCIPAHRPVADGRCGHEQVVGRLMHGVAGGSRKSEPSGMRFGASGFGLSIVPSRQSVPIRSLNSLRSRPRTGDPVRTRRIDPASPSTSAR